MEEDVKEMVIYGPISASANNDYGKAWEIHQHCQSPYQDTNPGSPTHAEARMKTTEHLVGSCGTANIST
jgi:hypothetical protein